MTPFQYWAKQKYLVKKRKYINTAHKIKCFLMLQNIVQTSQLYMYFYINWHIENFVF